MSTNDGEIDTQQLISAASLSTSMNEDEDKLKTEFSSLTQRFEALDKLSNSKKREELKGITSSLAECKRLIKDFEREARTDNVPPNELRERKNALVSELNKFVAKKKAAQSTLEYKQDSGASGSLAMMAETGDASTAGTEGMSTLELMEFGRGKIKETDESLVRTKKVMVDTIELGTSTAAKLSDQTDQMGRIIDDLDHIHFDMKKAAGLIRDITRQLATDKCIMGFLCLIGIGVIAIIALKIANPSKDEDEVIPGEEVDDEYSA